MGVVRLYVVLCHILILLVVRAQSKCEKSYTCRNFTLEFPLTTIDNPECGLLRVEGCDNSTYEHPILHLGASTSAKSLLGQTSKNRFLILDLDLQTSLDRSRSCYTFSNISLPQSPSVSFSFSPSITFFTCFNNTPNNQIEDHFRNYSRESCSASTAYYHIPVTQDRAPSIPGDCSLIQLPVNMSDENSTNLLQLLTPTFELEWNVSEACNECFNGGGQCLVDNENKFHCKTAGKSRWKLILAICLPGAAVTLSFFYMLCQLKQRMAAAKILSRNLSSDSNVSGDHAKANEGYEKDIELFLKNNGNVAPMRYKYSTIKKTTNLFSQNLGKGGFGSVFKGKLPDGRLVAVKVLNESNGNGEDFMNEVGSISRTSHVNIVSLLGFCFEGSKRALVYDFMPNGSLEKFIGNTAESGLGLGWDKLFGIALGIARGLEYLHQGCNTRILHLDIKPQNILLDKDLNPRISDFGLAKLCPNRSSIVSMMVARGTIGYIAPEVFSRNFGEVSYKSDVYSYGMLVLEMVGGRGAIDRREADHTSEIYFPHYIYQQLEEDAERDSVHVGTMDEGEGQVVRRNLMVVGLWCIQTNPKDRPSMTKVVEMLEGKLGSVEIPPKPYLFSPPRTAPTSSVSESL